MPGRLLDEPNYGIDRRNTTWLVTVYRSGKRHYRSFSDAAFGSEAAAFEAAQVWRNGVIQNHPPPLRAERASKLRTSNTSGVSGVTCETYADGTPRLWRTRTVVDGVLHQKTFSVRVWGEDARDKAIEERRKHLACFSGLAYVHPAEPAIREKEAVNVEAEIERLKSGPRGEAALRRSNRSGHAGVSWKKGHGDHPGYWVAQRFTGAHWMCKSFSIAEHGHEQAKLLAIEERRQQLNRDPEIAAAALAPHCSVQTAPDQRPAHPV